MSLNDNVCSKKKNHYKINNEYVLDSASLKTNVK